LSFIELGKIYHLPRYARFHILFSLSIHTNTTPEHILLPVCALFQVLILVHFLHYSESTGIHWAIHYPYHILTDPFIVQAFLDHWPHSNLLHKLPFSARRSLFVFSVSFQAEPLTFEAFFFFALRHPASCSMDPDSAYQDVEGSFDGTQDLDTVGRKKRAPYATTRTLIHWTRKSHVLQRQRGM